MNEKVIRAARWMRPSSALSSTVNASNFRTRSLAAIAVALAAFGLLAGPAYGMVAGHLDLLDPNTLHPIRGGGSETLFALAPPSNARCPGDTQDGGYSVFSYMMPQGTDLAHVAYLNLQPVGGFPLVTTRAPYIAKNTEVRTARLPPLPTDFTFGRWGGPRIALLFPRGGQSAVWEAGLSCLDAHGHTSAYWNTEIIFKTSAKDPHGFTWAVAAGRRSDKIPLLGILIAAAAAAGGVLVLVYRLIRRRNHAGRLARPSANLDAVRGVSPSL